MPTAYGIGGYDAMLSEMMLSLGWGLVGGMLVTLILVPTAYACESDLKRLFKRIKPPRWLAGLGVFLMVSQPVFSMELSDRNFIKKALANNPSYQLILTKEIGQRHAIDYGVAVSDIVTTVLLGTSYDLDSQESIPDSAIRMKLLLNEQNASFIESWQDLSTDQKTVLISAVRSRLIRHQDSLTAFSTVDMNSFDTSQYLFSYMDLMERNSDYESSLDYLFEEDLHKVNHDFISDIDEYNKFGSGEVSLTSLEQFSITNQYLFPISVVDDMYKYQDDVDLLLIWQDLY